MKIRSGFVSNSSSSSFVVGYKSKKPTKQELIDIFKVNESSPLYTLVNDIAEYMLNKINNKNDTWTKSKLIESYIDNPEDKNDNEIIHEILMRSDMNREMVSKIINDGYTVYSGYVHDDGDPVENMFCFIELTVDTKDFFVIKEDGY